MRRMEKEFNKIFLKYQNELEKFGVLDTEQAENQKWWARDTIAKDCDLNLDVKRLCGYRVRRIKKIDFYCIWFKFFSEITTNRCRLGEVRSQAIHVEMSQ